MPRASILWLARAVKVERPFAPRLHLDNAQLIQLFRNDLVAQVEEVLSKRYPDQNLSRVVKAIAARCNAAEAVDQAHGRSQTATAGMKVRL